MKRVSMSTRPACSSLARWLERLPFVKPVVRCRKTKSALRTEERTVRIASRPGSWMSRSSGISSLSADIALLDGQAVGAPEGLHEEAVIERAADRHRDARQQEA